ncbi:MAG: CinA family protein [Candidatus Methylomirabilia bacterium]
MSAVDALAVRVGRALLFRAARLAVAESCTGGLVGARVTGVPGSSRYLLGGVVAYHNSAKMALLQVPRRMLGRFGAVSAPVAAAMARGARRLFKAEIGVAVTGIAGPGGASAGKPVGLVYVAVCGYGRTRCRKALFEGARQRVRDQAADLALIMLLEHLEEREKS